MRCVSQQRNNYITVHIFTYKSHTTAHMFAVFLSVSLSSCGLCELTFTLAYTREGLHSTMILTQSPPWFRLFPPLEITAITAVATVTGTSTSLEEDFHRANVCLRSCTVTC